MKYRVGDVVICQFRQVNNYKKIVLEPNSESEEMEFQIISRNPDLELYMLLVPDDFTGWTISDFHIVHQNVAKLFKGKKFYELAEGSILRKK